LLFVRFSSTEHAVADLGQIRSVEEPASGASVVPSASPEAHSPYITEEPYGDKKLEELFHDTLKDIYFAEKKILMTLPKMRKTLRPPSISRPRPPNAANAPLWRSIFLRSNDAVHARPGPPMSIGCVPT
jgi:Domain of unknown function (DUF892)